MFSKLSSQSGSGNSPVELIDLNVDEQFIFIPDGMRFLIDAQNQPEESDDYNTVKSKLLSFLATEFEDHTFLYDPLQKKQLADTIKKLIISLNDDFYLEGFSCRLFQKYRQLTAPPRDAAYKADMLKQVFLTLLNPLGEIENFNGYVEHQKTQYPKDKADDLEIVGKLQVALAIFAMAASLYIGFLTCGIGFLGLIPTAILAFRGFSNLDNALMAKERDNFDEMNATWHRSFDKDNLYINTRRTLFYNAGILNHQDRAPIEIDKNIKVAIISLVKNLEQTDLSEDEKTAILSKVNKTIVGRNDPEKLSAFGDFIEDMQIKYPTKDSAATCAKKKNMCKILAYIGGLMSIALIKLTFGISALVGVLCYGAGRKYYQHKDHEEHLTRAKNQLDIINQAFQPKR